MRRWPEERAADVDPGRQTTGPEAMPAGDHAAAADPEAVHAVLLAACRADVAVFKPGNVSIRSPGHGMQAEDFITSATVALPRLLERTACVGPRVQAAVAATQRAVGCNTNLGILLLLAPLAEAALRPGRGGLRTRLRACLPEIRAEPVAPWLAAIRLAAPGGLGRSERLDATDQAPAVGTLGDAMQHAASRDRIAHQYLHDFEDVFDVGLATVRSMMTGHATLAAYLAFLTRFKDTHVQRKHGEACAEWVRVRARPVADLQKACDNPPALTGSLEDLDEVLKRVGVNPGTSADLTVASLAAAGLDDLLMPGRSARGTHVQWFDAVFHQR